jgi:hypothetical protein
MGGLLEEFQVTVEGNPMPSFLNTSHLTLLVKANLSLTKHCM